jgi:hypothetical protein
MSSQFEDFFIIFLHRSDNLNGTNLKFILYHNAALLSTKREASSLDVERIEEFVECGINDDLICCIFIYSM